VSTSKSGFTGRSLLGGPLGRSVMVVVDPVAMIVLVGEVGVVVRPGADLRLLDGEGGGGVALLPAGPTHAVQPRRELVLAAKTIVGAAGLSGPDRYWDRRRAALVAATGRDLHPSAPTRSPGSPWARWPRPACSP
jgi:hypothetical protein